MIDDRSRVHAAVLAWGRANGRVLAFRTTRDPYRVLVAETMAQQTQVSRVEACLDRFLAAFPDLASLAAAPVGEVLRAWRGLGYHRRALALRRAAQAVMTHHQGALPSDVTALERLPGVGPYTARAIAVHAFGARLGPVDTNVRRVLGRVEGRELRARELQALADALAPADSAAWTDALMDIGAGPCRPAAPACAACPLRPWCRTAQAGPRLPDAPEAPGRHAARRRRPGEGVAVPFSRTTRWLRGRILDRLRDLDAHAWATFDGPLGEHPHADVLAMLGVLASEGLLERHGSAPAQARLPQ